MYSKYFKHFVIFRGLQRNPYACDLVSFGCHGHSQNQMDMKITNRFKEHRNATASNTFNELLHKQQTSYN